ncbi:MAG: DNA repair protein RecN [Leptolyngbyaceae bacterium]|nr:DNA repair protein RecN [Leptolyngbyaceae bacterium]
MLLSLQIENFALVDRLTLEFGTGLHILTGETGAGKSIILDAIDAVLGGKVTSRVIRTGAERALLEATFKLGKDLEDWLTEQEIDLVDQATLVCSREITTGQGNLRSRSRLNGVLVNKQQMESVRAKLVEITAQGQTVQLGQPTVQRDWLDSFGGVALLQQREVVGAAFTVAQQALQALEKRRHSEQQRLQQLDLFEYQARELRTANLSDPDEMNQLEQERQRLSHSVELQQQSYQVYQALYQNDSGGSACADLLGQAENLLSDMVRYDGGVQSILDLVSDALAQVEEAGRQINAYGEAVETDPQRLQVVEDRISELKQVCRKYGPTLVEAIAYSHHLQTELAELTGGGQSLEALEEAYQTHQATLLEACAHLTQLRQAAATTLEARLVAELKPLAMDKVQFHVQITPIAPTSAGADQITFLFSPNPGEPLQPLTETASGGEMSRFLLALKACFSQIDGVGTMVFDEIDVGVSGRVAQAIAEKLYQLSQRHQVLCVTHQPMVAAMADHHFRVNKVVIDEPIASFYVDASDLEPIPEAIRTVVRVNALDTHQRREELAQLAGGTSDQEAIAFADSLLTQAASTRQSQTDLPTTLPTTAPAKPKAASSRSKSSKNPKKP